MSERQALSYLEEKSAATTLLPGQWVQIGIALADSDLLVGDIGLHLFKNEDAVEIGFTLARQQHGKGVAAEAAQLAIDAAFASSMISKVRGITDARNVASIRLLERVGFRKVSEYATTFRDEPCTEYAYEKYRT